MEDFIQYIKCPTHSYGFKKINWQEFFLLLGFYIVAVISIGMFLFIVSLFLHVEHKNISLTFYERIIFAVLLAPIIEESLFRLLLVFNKRNLFYFFVMCVGLFITFLVRESYFKLFLFILLSLISIIIYFYFEVIKSFLVKNYRCFFYFIVVLFAVLHLFNFNGINSHNLFVAIILVVPQIILGLILGYLRIKYGIAYSILFHAIVNLSVLLS